MIKLFNFFNKDSVKETQNKKILKMMKNREEVTNYNCSVNHKILRLSARINDLERAGYKIKHIVIHDKNDRRLHWTRYELEL